MKAEHFFDDASTYADDLGHEMVIDKDQFLHFAEVTELHATERLTKLKDDTTSLLEHIIAHEWNISGPGLTRIKGFMATLSASK